MTLAVARRMRWPPIGSPAGWAGRRAGVLSNAAALDDDDIRAAAACAWW